MANDLLPDPQRGPAHRTLARTIGIAIVTAQYAPGSILPGEYELAERHGISRGVVREALRMLSAKGLLESKPKTGTRVRDRRDWNLLDPDLMAWMFEAEPPASFVRSLFQLRLIVEPSAAELAATLRTSRQLSGIGHALEEMYAHGLASPIGQAADQRFHHLILDATHNELLISLAGTIGAAVRWTTIYKHRQSVKPSDSMPQHQRLFDAIAAGDPDAARLATVDLIRQAETDTASLLTS